MGLNPVDKFLRKGAEMLDRRRILSTPRLAPHVRNPTRTR
jgi:hypothetical protein